MVSPIVIPPDFGSLFAGIGSLLMALVVIWILVKLFRPIFTSLDLRTETALKYAAIEDYYLREQGKEKGLDLDEEVAKLKLKTMDKDFQKKIREKIYDEWFKEKPKDKAKK